MCACVLGCRWALSHAQHMYPRDERLAQRLRLEGLLLLRDHDAFHLEEHVSAWRRATRALGLPYVEVKYEVLSSAKAASALQTFFCLHQRWTLPDRHARFGNARNNIPTSQQQRMDRLGGEVEQSRFHRVYENATQRYQAMPSLRIWRDTSTTSLRCARPTIRQ